MNYFRGPACAVDFSKMAEIDPRLKEKAWLPTDIDGITHRFGRGGRPDRFLVTEIKHGNEGMSGGQEFMLRALAALPNFTVLLVTDRMTAAVEGRRAFDPICYYRLGATHAEDGETVSEITLADF